MDYLSIFFRWFHIIFGILWIGMLWFFNFVNGPMQGSLDGDTKKKVVPELMPRALFWFRMGAAGTWVTGVLLLGLVFMTSNLFMNDPTQPSGAGHALFFSFLIAPFIYDALAKSSLAKDPKTFAAICFVLVVGLLFLFAQVLNFGYRGYTIEIGALFGTIMAYNVWFRIWPAQKKIIMGVKTGNPADASIVAMAGARSKHNTYMSIPLLWTMINMHSTFGEFSGEYGWIILAVVIGLGWMIAMQLYKRAAKVKGF